MRAKFPPEQPAELQGRITGVEVETSLNLEDNKDISVPAILYTTKERMSVRETLLQMNDKSFVQMNNPELMQSLHADRAKAEEQFEIMMASYFADNGKGNDKKSMKLASELFVSFFMGDGDKSLRGFHAFIDNSTKSNENLNAFLIKRSNQGR